MLCLQLPGDDAEVRPFRAHLQGDPEDRGPGLRAQRGETSHGQRGESLREYAFLPP